MSHWPSSTLSCSNAFLLELLLPFPSLTSSLRSIIVGLTCLELEGRCIRCFAGCVCVYFFECPSVSSCKRFFFRCTCAETVLVLTLTVSYVLESSPIQDSPHGWNHNFIRKSWHSGIAAWFSESSVLTEYRSLMQIQDNLYFWMIGRAAAVLYVMTSWTYLRLFIVHIGFTIIHDIS